MFKMHLNFCYNYNDDCQILCLPIKKHKNRQMKNLFLSCTLFLAILMLGSCDKYNDGMKDSSIYTNVYMPGATRSLITNMTQGDSVFHLIYSAYLGGISGAKGDINVTFEIDSAAVDSFNAVNGTNYRLLPRSNYSIQSFSALVRSGTRSTDSMTLTVRNDDHLSLFKTYLLPIKISGADGGGAKVLQSKSTSFYIFTVGTQKVLSLGSDWGGILSVGPKLSVISNLASTFDILLNLPDSNKVYSAPPLHIGINWNASESFYYVNENSMVVRNTPPFAGLFNFIMNPDLITQNNPDPANGIIYGDPNFWLGDHWNEFIIAPYNNYFFTEDENGILWRLNAYVFWDWQTPSNTPRTQVASGFNYTQVLSYPSMNPNALICVNSNGDLWYYPVSQDGTPGTGKQVGSGWNIFKKIIVVGNDILALNNNNDLYRITFNPDSFINLN